MIEGTGVGLMKTLFDLRSATPDSRDALLAAVRDAAKAYRAAVFADGAIDLVDDSSAWWSGSGRNSARPSTKSPTPPDRTGS